MWNLISHFLIFAGGMASGVMLMCLMQTGKLADKEFETMKEERKHNRYNFLPRRYQAADSGSSLMGGNAYASMQHRSADKLLYIQSPIRRSPARMDCGVFGFDKV